MTSLMAWAAVDSNGISSLNLASDSRITWFDAKNQPVGTWDHAKKLFASTTTSDVLGYCGNSLLAGIILGQFIDALSIGVISHSEENPSAATELLAEMIDQTLGRCPVTHRSAFQILHGVRFGSGMKSKWYLFQLDCDGTHCKPPQRVSMPNQSGVLAELGSGIDSMKASQSNWSLSDISGTSRAIFSGFCDSIRLGRDPYSGGPPQLCRLVRKNSATPIGMIWEGDRYISGLRVAPHEAFPDIEWFNDLFERCDPLTAQRIPSSQRQPRPKGISPYF